MSYTKITINFSQSQIEEKARGLGMDYPSEFKVIYDKEENK
ncbi:MAG: hypothetical protein ACERKV_10095 [Clostridiaceae bacterium]